MTVERLLPPTTGVLDLVFGSLLRLAAHHESSCKIDSTFALPLFQGSHQFGAIGEPAVARIKTVYKERDRTERRALLLCHGRCRSCIGALSGTVAALRAVRTAVPLRGGDGGLGRSYRRSDTVTGCNSNYTFEELKHGCKISPDLPSSRIPFKSPSCVYRKIKPARSDDEVRPGWRAN